MGVEDAQHVPAKVPQLTHEVELLGVDVHK